MNESPCIAGSYAPVEGLGQCWLCPQGYTCPGLGTVVPNPCPTGYYCPNGTSTTTGIACPAGTFNSIENRTSLADCQSCPAGKYCAEQSLSSPSGDCSGGYLCLSGAKIATPNDGTNTLCPIGKYCVNGTQTAALCPAGTMRKSPGAATEEDCEPCDPGKYCEITGLTKPTGECSQGFYCPDQAKIKTSEPTSYPCPRGYFCNNGTSVPKGCLPGTYQPSDGNWNCLTCPAGKYCSGNTSIPEACPPYHYCPNGTVAPLVCPNGTHTTSNLTGLSQSSDCLPCPRGFFCLNGVTTDKCNGGYLCLTGSDIPNPTDGIRGRICRLGYYCPPGALEEQKCPPGLVVGEEGSASINDCQRCPAGYVCTIDSTVPQPCEAGYYCPFNITRQPCREGTYNNETRATDESFCKSCPAGYWCKGPGVFLILIFYLKRFCSCQFE